MLRWDPRFASNARWRAPPRRGHASSAHRNRRAVERRRLSPSAGQSSAGCASTREGSVDPLLVERAFCCCPTGRWSRSAVGLARAMPALVPADAPASDEVLDLADPQGLLAAAEPALTRD